MTPTELSALAHTHASQAMECLVALESVESAPNTKLAQDRYYFARAIARQMLIDAQCLAAHIHTLADP